MDLVWMILLIAIFIVLACYVLFRLFDSSKERQQVPPVQPVRQPAPKCPRQVRPPVQVVRRRVVRRRQTEDHTATALAAAAAAAMLAAELADNDDKDDDGDFGDIDLDSDDFGDLDWWLGNTLEWLTGREGEQVG